MAGMTLDEKVALINKKRQNDVPAAERKKRRREQEANNVVKKQSHDWHSEWTTYNSPNGGQAGVRTPLYCKKCKINYWSFKIKPQSCDEVLGKDSTDNPA